MNSNRVSLLLLVLLAVDAHGFKEYIEDTDRFPGWKGSLPSTLDVQYHAPGNAPDDTLWHGRVEQVSWKPRVYVLHDFLNDAECDHIVTLARKQLHKSTVVDSSTGGSVDSEVRTSSGTFLQYAQDEIIARIEKRIATVTMIPETHQESIQVLRYVDGQKYEPHTDSFHDSFNTDQAHGGQRMATVLMYLSTPEEGGETVFPYAEEKVSGPGWSECALQGLSVKATKGTAVLFYSLNPDGTEDIASTHGSCPTLKGEKWSAPKWIHVKPFNVGREMVEAPMGGCRDENVMCPEWAYAGECTNNPTYMALQCRKSCKKCGDPSGIGAKSVMGRKIGF